MRLVRLERDGSGLATSTHWQRLWRVVACALARVNDGEDLRVRSSVAWGATVCPDRCLNRQGTTGLVVMADRHDEGTSAWLVCVERCLLASDTWQVQNICEFGKNPHIWSLPLIVLYTLFVCPEPKCCQDQKIWVRQIWFANCAKPNVNPVPSHVTRSCLATNFLQSMG
jgi:hypothetical protein